MRATEDISEGAIVSIIGEDVSLIRAETPQIGVAARDIKAGEVVVYSSSGNTPDIRVTGGVPDKSVIRRGDDPRTAVFSYKHDVCGGIAFTVEGAPLQTGERVSSARVTLPDGTHPITGTRLVCGSCGEPITLNPELLKLVAPSESPPPA